MKGEMGRRKTSLRRRRVRELYYIAHVDNIQSILQKGILSHELIEKDKVKFTAIYDKEIVEWRREREVHGKSLWSFANLYFNARNPMLYRIMCEKNLDDIAVLGISPSVLALSDTYITTGNAACVQTEFLRYSPTMASEILKETEKKYWTEPDGSKRRIMAEFLIPEVIPPEHINSIYTAYYKTREKIQGSLGVHASRVSVITQPGMFFQPIKKIVLTPKLTVVDGDMFFSRMQTITVSVNTVGVMGKGVASRARHQFPDVFVLYHDMCRQRKLKMGEPYLYKRESSTDYQLADEPSTLSKANAETWFLLFPTKNHWRYPADIKGIERGLKWLCQNYRRKKITSLAIPALGCGLGRLKWGKVGPLLCRYLATLDIPVYVYLPTERKIPKELLSKDFLLEQNQHSPLLSSRAHNELIQK